MTANKKGQLLMSMRSISHKISLPQMHKIKKLTFRKILSCLKCHPHKIGLTNLLEIFLHPFNYVTHSSSPGFYSEDRQIYNAIHSWITIIELYGTETGLLNHPCWRRGLFKLVPCLSEPLSM